MSQTISSPVTELLASNAIHYDVIEIPLSEDKNLSAIWKNYSVVRARSQFCGAQLII